MTSITATSPLTGGVITSTGSIGCQTASGSQAGCLSAADWTTFNGKLDTSLAKGNFFVGNDAGVAQATSSIFINSNGRISVASTTASNASFEVSPNGGINASTTGTGTISASGNSRTLTGTGTLFDTQLVVGDVLEVSGTRNFVVMKITSSTSIDVAPITESSISAKAFRIRKPSLVVHGYADQNTSGNFSGSGMTQIDSGLFIRNTDKQHNPDFNGGLLIEDSIGASANVIGMIIRHSDSSTANGSYIYFPASNSNIQLNSVTIQGASTWDPALLAADNNSSGDVRLRVLKSGNGDNQTVRMTTESINRTNPNLQIIASTTQFWTRDATSGVYTGVTQTASMNLDGTWTHLTNVGFSTSSPSAVVAIQGTTTSQDLLVIATSSRATVSGVDVDGHPYTSGPPPVISSCGTGSPTIVGDDQGGTITTGTAATSCTATFAKVYPSAPYCMASDNSGTITPSVSTTASAITFGLGAGLSGGVVYYQCAYHR